MSKELVLGGCSMVADYVSYKNKMNAKNPIPYRVFDPINEVHVKVHWEHMEPFPTPSAIMAKQYGMKDVNKAIPGAGNTLIFNMLSDYIHKNYDNIGLVVACWSNTTRIDLPLDPKRSGDVFRGADNYYSIIFSEFDDTEHNRKTLGRAYPIWKTMHTEGMVHYKSGIDDLYRYILTLDALCHSYGIPCIQGASLITYPTSNKYMQYWISHPMAALVDDVNFYGWPIFHDIGGNLLFDFYESNFLTPYDSHPNEVAHAEMANKLIAYIDENKIL